MEARMTDNEFLELVKISYPRHVRIGKVTGQVRLTGPAWDEVRAYVYQRENGICQESGRRVKLEKGYWDTMHCAHIRSKGSGGSDLPSNLRCLSLEPHAQEHAGRAALKGSPMK
jgi:hypothetical protein